MSFRNSVIKSLKWSSFSQAGQQVVSFATTAVLARLLAPADFGLLSMATVVTGFISLFGDLGTSAAVIQKKEATESFMSSMFWSNISFGIFSMSLLWSISPLAADFYHESRVGPLLRLLSLSIFLSSLHTVQKSILIKRLAFDKIARIEIASSFFASIVGIVAALTGSGVWSLAYQSVSVSAISTVLLWRMSGWRPKLVFKWDEVKGVIWYCTNLTGTNTVNYFSRNADYIIIGRFLSASDLGYYTLAYKLMLYPLQSVSEVIGKILFPVYSQMQEKTRLRAAYLTVAATIGTITFPMMTGLMVLSRPFVITVFGEHWMPVIPLLLILAPVGMVQSILYTTNLVPKAMGRSDVMLKVVLITTTASITAFLIGLKWGIIGIASAYAIATLITTYPSLAIPFKLIDLKVSSLLAVLWRPLICSVVMVGIVGSAVMISSASDRILLFITLILLGMITYITASWTFNKNIMRQMLDAIGIRTT